MHKLKSMYPTSILKSIYNTLILPNINYCMLSWGSQIDKIHYIQKRAIRNISKSEFREYMAILKFYSKLINNILPHYFETFTPNFFCRTPSL